jgi:polar amino acid transport system substrate-binding protein
MAAAPLPLLRRFARRGLPALLAGLAIGAAPLAGSARELRVGLSGSPPFVMREGDDYGGISMDVWQELALDGTLAFRIVPQDSTEESLSEVAAGRLDLAIGPISITPERLERQRIEFTQPYFFSHIGLLLPAEPPGLWERIQPFFGVAALSSLLVLFVSLFLVGNLIWLAERGRNSDQFPPSYSRGVANGMWFAVVTLTTVGYGDRAPVTVAGRWIAGAWMIVTLLAVSSITAGLASAFTVSLASMSSEDFHDPADLRGITVAVIDGTTSVRWGELLGSRLHRVVDLDEAADLLERGEVRGVIFDRPALRHYLAEHPARQLRLASFTIATESYGIALPQNSPLRRTLDISLLKLRQSGRVREIADQWLPSR